LHLPCGKLLIWVIKKLKNMFQDCYQVHVDDLAEVGVHEFHDNVKIQKFLQTFLRRERIQQTNYLKHKNIKSFHKTQPISHKREFSITESNFHFYFKYLCQRFTQSNEFEEKKCFFRI
jgi:hypothetical protein